MKLVFTEAGWKDYVWWQDNNRKLLNFSWTAENRKTHLVSAIRFQLFAI